MQRYFNEFEQELLGSRLRIFRAILVLVVFIIGFRFWQLQVLEGKKWKLIAVENQFRTIRILPGRGMILDREGRIIAGNKLGFNLTVIPADIDEETLKELAQILNITPGQLKERIQKNRLWSPNVPVEVKRDLSFEELSRIEERLRDFSGVDIKLQPVRSYPLGEIACHILGYLGEISPTELKQTQYQGYQLGDYIGKSGVEKLLEKELRGVEGYKYKIVDAQGRERGSEILPGLTLEPKLPEPGNNVVLSVNLDLQILAEEMLKGKVGAIVMLSTKTGEVLVMASSPGFNPEIFVNPSQRDQLEKLMTDPKHPLYNRAIQGTYPMGSVFKLVLAIAGLEENLITPETTVRCNGVYYLGKIPFRCWRKNGHGVVAFNRAIVESCDVYFYTLGSRLGIDRIARYANLLGLGLKTQLGLEPENPGLIPSTSWMEKVRKQKWNPGDTISVSIGQGYMLATPLQAAVLAMVIANEGELYRPRLVKQIEKRDGTLDKIYSPELITKLRFKEKNWKLLKEAMIGVVNKPGGTAYWTVRSDKVLIAGKTGTAQVIRVKKFEGMSQEAIPEKYRDHAWFIAFAPAEDPQIAISVLVEHGMHGSSGAGPLAKKLIEKYFEIYPDQLPKQSRIHTEEGKKEEAKKIEPASQIPPQPTDEEQE